MKPSRSAWWPYYTSRAPQILGWTLLLGALAVAVAWLLIPAPRQEFPKGSRTPSLAQSVLLAQPSNPGPPASARSPAKGIRCQTTSEPWPQQGGLDVCILALVPLAPPLIVDDQRIRVAFPLWNLPDELPGENEIGQRGDRPEAAAFALIDVSLNRERLVAVGQCPENESELAALFLDRDGTTNLACVGPRQSLSGSWVTIGELKPESGDFIWGAPIQIDSAEVNRATSSFLLGKLRDQTVIAVGQGNYWSVRFLRTGSRIHEVSVPYAFFLFDRSLMAIGSHSADDLDYYERMSLGLNDVAVRTPLSARAVSAKPVIWRNARAWPSEREPPVFIHRRDTSLELALPIPVSVTADVPVERRVELSLNDAVPMGGVRAVGPEILLYEDGDALRLQCELGGPSLELTSGSHQYARAICNAERCVVVFLEPLRSSEQTGEMLDPQFRIVRIRRANCSRSSAPYP